MADPKNAASGQASASPPSARLKGQWLEATGWHLRAGGVPGQASTEYIILLAVALVIMTMVTVFVYLWPDYTYSVRKQRSDDYWNNARPFSVKSHMMVPNQLVLEIENKEPISLIVQRIWIDGNSFAFSNHSIPFTWVNTTQCPSGVCAMAMRPGEVQIISSENFTTNPANPCIVGSDFSPGLTYEVDFGVQYYYSDKLYPENQTGKVKLAGTCTAR